jgi:hypothetical protein
MDTGGLGDDAKVALGKALRQIRSAGNSRVKEIFERL